MLLLALLVQTFWLASWGRKPHCANLYHLLELELMLLLALLTFAPATCYMGPWCACQSLFESWGYCSCLPFLYTPFG